MKPNVLLICVDQMRGDCIGITGHPDVETPNLDTMARNGAVFSRAYSATPTCIPARAALLTGLTQRSHGRVGYEDCVPWNYEHTIASTFTDAGYHTKCVGKMHVYPHRNLCGFHDVELHDGYLHCNRKYDISQKDRQSDDYLDWLREKRGMDTDLIDSGLDCNSWVARPWMYDETLHPTNWVVTRSIEFLKRKDPTKPFFLMSSFVRPHSPLDPPQAYFDMYKDRDLAEPYMGDWADTVDADKNGRIVDCYNGIIDPRGLKRARAAYYALITHIDHQIGRLLQALWEYGELNNTIILFTSDHGDLLGDHNLIRKSYPYEGSTSIPFIIYDPGNHLGIKNNTVINKLVELRDVMPTLLDLVGAPIPESVEGHSVRPLLSGDCDNWREYIHGEHQFREDSNHFIVTEKDKYIWYSQTGEEQYFDLENDPHELKNIIHDEGEKERIDYLRKLLIKELTGREEGYTDGEKLIVGRKPINSLKHIL